MVRDGGVSEWGPWGPGNGHCTLLEPLVYAPIFLPPSHTSLGVGAALPGLAVTSGQSCLSKCVSHPICEWRQWLNPSIRALPSRGPETLKLSACPTRHRTLTLLLPRRGCPQHRPGEGATSSRPLPDHKRERGQFMVFRLENAGGCQKPHR